MSRPPGSGGNENSPFDRKSMTRDDDDSQVKNQGAASAAAVKLKDFLRPTKICKRCGIDMGVDPDEYASHVCDAASYGPLDYVANMIYSHTRGPDAARWYSLSEVLKEEMREHARKLVAGWVVDELNEKSRTLAK